MSTEKEIIRYIHRSPKQESNEIITNPGVQFRSFDEICLDVDEKKLLYTTEIEVVDMSCCGTSTSGFATVYGYVDQWKSRQTEQGDFISFIEPIRDEAKKREISQMIKEKDMVGHVNFK